MFLVDIGNTWTKSAFCREGVLIHGSPIKTMDLNAAKLKNWPFVKDPGFSPKKILISSVSTREVSEDCGKILANIWSVKPEFARVFSTFKGMKTLYDPKTLGVDRWLACLAAWSFQRKNLIVVDAGTAITVDFVVKEGTHMGGIIAPGPVTMLNALERDTALLPKVKDNIDQFLVPDNTKDAIALGVESSLLGLLRQIKFRSTSVFDSEPLWLFTGGAADRLAAGINWPHLKKRNLVLDGLSIYGTPLTY
ncbi:MAG: type III pantothenate kinase [Pseudomonadota bacterium]|nr:type III pantothenate kinase [Pseudomonadota bacterium]